jgi:hypothetical protein
MRKSKLPPKAHEITTIYSLNGVGKQFMGKYIVIAQNTSKAISLIPFKEGEEVLQAREMQGYQVLMEKS